MRYGRTVATGGSERLGGRGPRSAPRLVVVVTAALLAAASSVAVVSAEGPGRPSVLIVTLDTTRADALGCYGRSPTPTPALDALAASGVRFEQAQSPAPLTAPAHASLFTGLVPRRHGVRDNAPDRLAGRFETLAERLRAVGWHTAAVVAAAVLDRDVGLDQGFESYDDGVRVGPRSWFDWRERGASQVAEAALARLASLEPPFLLWVHLYDPHLPYVPPSRFAGRFDPYHGEVAFADEAVGVLVEQARRRAGTAGLLVVAAGDHGESLGEHGEKDHGVFVYQATQRVPLLIAGPGVPAGRVVHERVGLVDVMPTLLGLLGLDVPGHLDGRDLRPAWGPRSARRRVVTTAYEMESLHPARAYGWAPLAALVRGRFKYVEAPRPELYDLTLDPGETRNLAASRPEVARALAEEIAARFEADAEFAGAGEGGTAPDAGAATAERRAMLRSLGYASGGGVQPGDVRPDPKDAIVLLADLERARRLLTRPEDPRRAGAEAERLVAALLEKNPGNQPARLVLAQAQLTAGRPSAAIATLEEATRRDPRDERAFVLLAEAWRARRGAASPDALDRAEQALRRALAIRPRSADAARALADLLVDRGRLDEARSVLAPLVESRAADAALATMLGEIEAARGRPGEARAAFESALALDPGHGPALEALGKLAFARGDAGAAAAWYRRALDAAPSARLARTLGAILLEALGDRHAAREAFERALALEPRGPDAERVRRILAEIEAGDAG